jgi:predicted metal-binding membrane protein
MIAAAARMTASNALMCVAFGLAMGMVHRPSLAVAGAITIAVGVYELSPLKVYLRNRFCEASCIGLMVLPMTLGLTSVAWMVACVAIATMQQLLPAMRTLDVMQGAVIVALGLLIVFAPDAIPAITQPIFLAAGQICG